MKRSVALITAFVIMLSISACGQEPKNQEPTAITYETSVAVTESSAVTSQPTEILNTEGETEGKTVAAPTVIEEQATAEIPVFDPYAEANRYDVPASMYEKYSDVDYGRLDKDVTYYSTVAGDNKQVNVLLPAGYDDSKTYPVMYVVHGFAASHNSHINTDSYLTLLYGNMLNENLTVPMILVGIDMYTDKQADKESKSYQELRYIYDKVIDEICVDLMPFIEQNYPVSTDRKDTAVAGVSEGGAKSLCIGFKWLDEFGWIGSFAPDSNVIPTNSDMTNYWNDPYMQEFPQPNANNTPFYLYMAVGSNDPWNIDCTFLYRDVLNGMGVKNQTDYVEGYGHDSDFWGQCYYNFLLKVFR